MNGFASYSGYSGIERRRHTVFPYFGEERRSSVRNNRALDDEAFLMERAATGDREAFVRLYDRFVDQVFKYVYFNVGRRSVAEQLTAEVFLSAQRELQQTGPARPSFGTWLYRLARDAVASYREISTLAPGDKGREESKRSLQKETVGALEQLADEQRQVIILRFLVGYTTEQVAEILGKQPAVIRTLQHRGLGGLGAILRKGAEK